MKEKINELLKELNQKKEDLNIAISLYQTMNGKSDKPTSNVLDKMEVMIIAQSEIIRLMTEYINTIKVIKST